MWLAPLDGDTWSTERGRGPRFRATPSAPLLAGPLWSASFGLLSHRSIQGAPYPLREVEVGIALGRCRILRGCLPAFEVFRTRPNLQPCGLVVLDGLLRWGHANECVPTGVPTSSRGTLGQASGHCRISWRTPVRGYTLRFVPSEEVTMSPKIGVLFDARPYAAQSLRPLDRIRMAVNVAETQGMRISLDGDHGVRSGLAGWVALHRQHPRRVSLLGAVCIVMQPPRGREVEAGACDALEVAGDWLHGLWDGFHGEAQLALLKGPSRALYLDGMRGGHLLFAELTVECPECGRRRYRREQQCVGCRP